MQSNVAMKIIAFSLLANFITLIPVWIVSLIFHDGMSVSHFTLLAISAMLGLIVLLSNRRAADELRAAQSFLFVVMTWITFSIVSTAPFLVSLNLSFDEAIFETVSGLTTTGATIFDEIDSLPKSILFYRSLLQWVGGMGIIVMVVAILPVLNVGGMQLFKAETPGPIKDEKLTPRIRHTARYLWVIYLGLTIACFFAYWLFGMPVLDAASHALTTISTGGFSTHTASLGFFNSPSIENVASLFMIAGSINFGLHFAAVRSFNPEHYFGDKEFTYFLFMVVIATLLIAISLFISGTYDDILTALRYATFEVVSIVSSTGFGIADFSHWPLFIPALLMLLSYVGGCAGSTAGGMKVIRIAVVFKGIGQQLKQLIHSKGVFITKFGERKVEPNIQQSIFAFLFIYTLTAMLFFLLLLMTGADYLTAFGAVTACINVLGPGLGDVTSSFHSMTPVAKLLLSVLMLIGRLEVFTVFVLFSPLYWRAIMKSRQV